MDLNSNTDTADHEAVTPSQPKIKYFWKKKHYSQRKYWPEKQEEVKTRKNMKPTKGRDSKTNSKVANDDEGMTLSYSIIQIPVFFFVYIKSCMSTTFSVHQKLGIDYHIFKGGVTLNI